VQSDDAVMSVVVVEAVQYVGVEVPARRDSRCCRSFELSTETRRMPFANVLSGRQFPAPHSSIYRGLTTRCLDLGHSFDGPMTINDVAHASDAYLLCLLDVKRSLSALVPLG
jgi:hypothetical protein